MKFATAVIIVMLSALPASQARVDTSKIGPQVGAIAPPFSGPDQNGVTRSLQDARGPKGTMLVFFRSADW